MPEWLNRIKGKWARVSEDADVGVDVDERVRHPVNKKEEDFFESKKEKKQRELERKIQEEEDRAEEIRRESEPKVRLAKARKERFDAEDERNKANTRLREYERKNPTTKIGKFIKGARQAGATAEQVGKTLGYDAPRRRGRSSYSRPRYNQPSRQSGQSINPLGIMGSSPGPSRYRVRSEPVSLPFGLENIGVSSPPPAPQTYHTTKTTKVLPNGNIWTDIRTLPNAPKKQKQQSFRHMLSGFTDDDYYKPKRKRRQRGFF